MPTTAQGLKDVILKRISQGGWRPGDRIDSVRELARSHRVAHATAARAIAELAQEGWLSARPGHGTFVSGGERSQTEITADTIIFAVLRQDELTSTGHNILDLMHGAQDEGRRRGYDLRLEVGLDPAAWDGFASDPRCAGAVLFNHEFLAPAKALSERHPVVWCGIGSRPPGVSQAVSDEIQAGRLAAEHLIALGHRRVAYLNAHAATLEPFLLRLAGAKTALTEHGLPAPTVLPWHVGIETAQAMACAKRMINGGSDAPTALIAGNDVMAVEFIEAAGSIGLRVPKHCSVVGWGGFAEARLRLPGLATVTVSSAGIGRSAVAVLDLTLRQSSLVPLCITVPTRLQPGTTAASPNSPTGG